MNEIEIKQHNDGSTFTVSLNYDEEIQTTVTCSGVEVECWLVEVLHYHRRILPSLIVGIHVEWRPNPPKALRDNPIALLQLCIGHRCLLFHILHADQVPTSLSSFLSDPRFTFVGVGMDDLVWKLYWNHRLKVSNPVDLRDLAAERLGRKDLRRMGLLDLARVVKVAKVEKPRRVRMSNWNRRLTAKQVKYACVDAFISFEVGRRIYAGQH